MILQHTEEVKKYPIVTALCEQIIQILQLYKSTRYSNRDTNGRDECKSKKEDAKNGTMAFHIKS